MNRFLRKIFNALAKPAMIGPHNKEADLLLSGAKPVGFTHPTQELETAVARGDLVKMEFEQDITQNYRIYSLPGQEDEALNRHANMIRDYWHGELKPEDRDLYSPVRSYTQVADQKVTKISGILNTLGIKLQKVFLGASAELEGAAERMRIRSAIESVQSGTMHSISFFEGFHNYSGTHDIHEQLESAVEQGDLSATEVRIPAQRTETIYGQPGQEDNMLRLIEILNGAEDAAPDEDGRIFGYTDDDIDLWNSDGYHSMTNPVTRFVMINTQPLRKWARQKIMMEDGPDWDRNMSHMI